MCLRSSVPSRQREIVAKTRNRKTRIFQRSRPATVLHPLAPTASDLYREMFGSWKSSARRPRWRSVLTGPHRSDFMSVRPCHHATARPFDISIETDSLMRPGPVPETSRAYQSDRFAMYG